MNDKKTTEEKEMKEGMFACLHCDSLQWIQYWGNTHLISCDKCGCQGSWRKEE